MLKKLLTATLALSLMLGGSSLSGNMDLNRTYAATQTTDISKADGLVKTANTLFKQGKYKEAIASADKALALNSANADAYYLKGQAYAKLKKTFESKMNYEKAAYANPTKYYKSVMAMKYNEKTGELSNEIFGMKISPAADWYYMAEPDLETVQAVSKTLNANKKMKQAAVEEAIASGWTAFSINKEDPSETASSGIVAMLSPIYTDPSIKNVDVFTTMLVDQLKADKQLKECSQVNDKSINGIKYKTFVVTFDIEGTLINQHYYITVKDQYAKIFFLTPVNEEDLVTLEEMMNTVK